jgi:hypothetical protein
MSNTQNIFEKAITAFQDEDWVDLVQNKVQ